MADPSAPLAAAIVSRWTAQAATLTGLAGPYHGETPTDKASTLPRCVFTIRSRLEHETSASQTWLHTLKFSIYGETPEACGPETAKVSAVFEPDSAIAAMPLSEGEINSIRAVGLIYTQVDKTLTRADLTYQIRTTRPRVTP